MPWGMFNAVGDIMTHAGGYRKYRGGVQYRGGTQMTKDFPPMVLNTSPHDTEHTPRY